MPKTPASGDPKNGGGAFWDGLCFYLVEILQSQVTHSIVAKIAAPTTGPPGFDVLNTCA